MWRRARSRANVCRRSATSRAEILARHGTTRPLAVAEKRCRRRPKTHRSDQLDADRLAAAREQAWRVADDVKLRRFARADQHAQPPQHHARQQSSRAVRPPHSEPSIASASRWPRGELGVGGERGILRAGRSWPARRGCASGPRTSVSRRCRSRRSSEAIAGGTGEARLQRGGQSSLLDRRRRGPRAATRSAPAATPRRRAAPR